MYMIGVNYGTHPLFKRIMEMKKIFEIKIKKLTLITKIKIEV